MKLQIVLLLMSVSLLVLVKSASASAQLSADTASAPARDAENKQTFETQILFRPSGRGRPPNTRGAGSRSDRLCPQDSSLNPASSADVPLPLTAVVPADQEALTAQEHPTLWVYLPETSARQMVLSIRDEAAQPHAQQFVSITGEAGIVGIPMDDTAPPLAIDQLYQWAIVLVCGDRPGPNDPVVTGWVRRVAIDAAELPQGALEQASWYGEQGIWYDALTTLADAMRSQPDNPSLTDVWADFLSQPSVGLEAIANEPLR